MKGGKIKGFSVVELMITVTIVAILVLVAVPNFREWMSGARIRTAAESIQNGMRIARNEAAQRGTTVRFELTSASVGSWQVCQLAASETTCQAASVFDSSAGSGVDLTIAASTDASKQSSGQLATALTGGVPAGITYSALGRPASFGANSISRVDIYGATAGGRRQVVLISSGGMVRMCDPSTALASNDAQSCGTN